MYERLAINPQRPCVLCGYPIEDNDIVLVESGSVVPRKRDPRTRYFLADWRIPQEEQPDAPIHKVYHFHCFQQLTTGEEWKVDPEDWQCHLCDQSNFKTDRWAFQITVGVVGERNAFLPDPEIQKQGIICIPCTISLFGEGNDEEGKLLLYGT